MLLCLGGHWKTVLFILPDCRLILFFLISQIKKMMSPENKTNALPTVAASATNSHCSNSVDLCTKPLAAMIMKRRYYNKYIKRNQYSLNLKQDSYKTMYTHWLLSFYKYLHASMSSNKIWIQITKIVKQFETTTKRTSILYYLLF